MATTRGKEVLIGRLYYRTKKSSGGQKKKKVVGAFAGIGGSSSAETGKNVSAQIQIFDDYEKVEKPGYKSKNCIKLEGAKIESSYSSPAVSNTGSPYASTIASPQNGIRLSASPSPSPSQGNGNSSGELYPFTVATSNGELHEFKTESENDRLRWVKLLQLLVMYPFSPIPEEPKPNPVKDSFRQSLEAKKFNASSVWPVYILPEEVGSKRGILGLHILALKSGIPNVSMGQLEIISPTDPSHPIVTWDRDKMRRTGKTGHLVFIEIGRRCEGGPGLVWMYTGYQNDAQALRETLHKFLFHGDGRAIPTNSQPQSLYDVPRSSFDSSLPASASSPSQSSSLQRRPSVPSNYHNHNLTRSRSQDHDSGYHSIGSNSGKTPPALEGPPVRLDKHPSIRRGRNSEPRMIRRSSEGVQSPCTPNGSYSERDNSEGIQFDCDQDQPSRSSSSDSPSPPDQGYVTGPMDGDESGSNSHHYDTVRDRSNSHPYYTPHAVDGGHSGAPPPTGDEYMAMINPRNRPDAYVLMRPASQTSPTHHSSTIPVPMPQPGGNASDEYHTLQHFSGGHRRGTSGSLNYETLPTINEKHAGDNYENHPLPQDLKGVMPRNYNPNYENAGEFRGRRGSHGIESYENIAVGNSNGNNNNCASGRVHREEVTLRSRDNVVRT